MEKQSAPLQRNHGSGPVLPRGRTRCVDALEWQQMKHRSWLFATLVGLIAPLGLAASESSAQAQPHAEFPTLDRAIQLARARALVVNDAQGELGVAHAQMVGARASAFGNPYVDIQVEQGLVAQPDPGAPGDRVRVLPRRPHRAARRAHRRGGQADQVARGRRERRPRDRERRGGGRVRRARRRRGAHHRGDERRADGTRRGEVLRGAARGEGHDRLREIPRRRGGRALGAVARRGAAPVLGGRARASRRSPAS